MSQSHEAGSKLSESALKKSSKKPPISEEPNRAFSICWKDGLWCVVTYYLEGGKIVDKAVSDGDLKAMAIEKLVRTVMVWVRNDRGTEKH